MHDMLNRFTSQREAINLLAANHVELPNFSTVEWQMMISLVKILKPIKDATVACQSRTISIGHVIPLTKLLQLDLGQKPVAKEFPAVQKEILDGMFKRLNRKNSNYK